MGIVGCSDSFSYDAPGWLPACWRLTSAPDSFWRPPEPGGLLIDTCGVWKYLFIFSFFFFLLRGGPKRCHPICVNEHEHTKTRP